MLFAALHACRHAVHITGLPSCPLGHAAGTLHAPLPGKCLCLYGSIFIVWDVQAQVYLEGQARAEVGEGLNKAAEVTLYGVYKRSKETGQPVTDPTAIEGYRKRLRRLAASQKSRFVGYEPQGGVWRFEVDHFSRCGAILLFIAAPLPWP